MRRLLFYIIAVVYPLQAIAQQHKLHTTDTVAVSAARANREAAVFTVINQDSTALQQYSNGSLASLLAANSLVTVKSYGPGGIATPTLRGSSASQVNVTYKGINLNSPLLGQSDFSLYPAFFFNAVSIGLGASGIGTNTGGLGGSINLGNRQNAPGNAIRLQSTYGAFGERGVAGKAGYSKGKVNASTALQYYTNANNFGYTNPADGGRQLNRNGRVLSKALFQTAGLQLNSYNRLEADIWLQESARQIAPTLYTNTQDSQEDKSARFFLTHSYNKSDVSYLNTVSYQQQGINYFNSAAGHTYVSTSKTLSALSTYSKFIGSRINLDATLTANTARALGESYHSDAVQNSAGITLKTAYVVLTNLQMVAGIRKDVVTSFNPPLLPFGGLVFNLDREGAKQTFKLNAAQNYRVPTLNDRFWLQGGNGNLLPEKAAQFELGYTLQLPRTLHVSASVFNSKVNNWIQWKDDGTGIWRPGNLKTVSNKGVELNFKAMHTIGKIYLEAKAGFSYTLAHDETNEGKQLIYTPLHQSNASLYASYKNIYLGGEEQYIGLRYLTADNDSWLPAYYLTNVFTGYTIKRKAATFNLNARVSNLLGYNYQSVALRPMPGRSFQLGLNYYYN